MTSLLVNDVLIFADLIIQGLAEELGKEGACEKAIFPDTDIVITRCAIMGNLTAEGVSQIITFYHYFLVSFLSWYYTGKLLGNTLSTKIHLKLASVCKVNFRFARSIFMFEMLFVMVRD